MYSPQELRKYKSFPRCCAIRIRLPNGGGNEQQVFLARALQPSKAHLWVRRRTPAWPSSCIRQSYLCVFPAAPALNAALSSLQYFFLRNATLYMLRSAGQAMTEKPLRFLRLLCKERVTGVVPSSRRQEQRFCPWEMFHQGPGQGCFRLFTCFSVIIMHL